MGKPPRVSTNDQDLNIQISALKAAGCGVIRSEKVSGSSTSVRAELRTLLDFVRKGDTLGVTRIDRLARSIADLAAIMLELEAKGASLKATGSREGCGGVPCSVAPFHSPLIKPDVPD